MVKEKLNRKISESDETWNREIDEKHRKKYNRAIGLTKQLPIENTERGGEDNAIKKSIIIKKSTDESCKSVLCIDALMLHTTDEEEVKSMIIEKGYKPEDYEINYKKH